MHINAYKCAKILLDILQKICYYIYTNYTNHKQKEERGINIWEMPMMKKISTII